MLADLSALKVPLSSVENDWKSREEALAVLLQALNHPSDFGLAFDFATSAPELIAYHFADLRSGIVKLASEVTAAVAKVAPNFAEDRGQSFADRFLQEPAYFKALGSGNKVIAKHAHHAIKSLTANNCISLELLKKLHVTHKANKINYIRENIAETFSVFMSLALNPCKKPLCATIVSNITQSDAESAGGSTPVLSATISSDAFQIEVDSSLNLTDTLGKTTANDVDFANLTQRIREDSFDFLKAVCEWCQRDSSPNVRNSGKEIKAKIAKIQEMYLSRQETNASTFSHEDVEALDKFGEGASSRMIIEPALSKETTSKISAQSAGLGGKASLAKNLPVEEKILRLLRADAKSAKDQTEELEKLILSASAPLMFSFDQYLEILISFNTAKNLSFKATLTRILTKADIGHFQFEILDYLLKEKLTRRTGFANIAKYITDRVTFEVLLNMVITKPYEELIGLLNKSFCPKKLLKILQKREVEPQEIASAIQRNCVKADAAGLTNPTQYKAQNIAFLQKIFADAELRTCFSGIDFAPGFVEKLREAGIEVDENKTAANVAVLRLRELIPLLAGCTTEGQVLARLTDILSATTLTDLQKTEFLQLTMAFLARKNAVTCDPITSPLLEPLQSCVNVLATTQQPNNIALAFLAIWAATPLTLCPESAIALLSLVVETQRIATAESARFVSENFVVLGSFTPLHVGCLLELLGQNLASHKTDAICRFLLSVCDTIETSPEANSFVLQLNLNFPSSTTVLSQLLHSTHPETHELAAQLVGRFSRFANPISYAAFVHSLSADLQSKIAIYGTK